MPAKNFTSRPVVEQFLQWDGSNYSEIETHINTYCLVNGIDQVVTNNGDGTISVDYHIYGIRTLNTGDWIDVNARDMVTAIPDTALQVRYQLLSGAEPRAYDITES